MSNGRGDQKRKHRSAERDVRAYAAHVLGLDPETLRVEKLAGDASARQYFRVRLPGGCHYVVARYPEPFDPATHPYCDVTALFLKAGLPVPQIFHADGRRAMMLLEDLGDVRLQEWLATAHPEQRRAAYREAVALILQIQNATQLAEECGSVAARVAFDAEKFQWELHFFRAHFFQYLGISPDPQQVECLHEEFRELAEELAAIPRVLTHRDFHSRNLMLYKNRQYIIDHQDARLGPPSYDLASLLGDPYVDMDEALVAEMIEFFLQEKARQDRAWSNTERRAAFRKELDLMLLQRLLKATGTYAYQTVVVGNSVYAPYIPRALERTARVLSRLGRFPALQEMLERTIASALPAKEGV